MTRKGTNGQVPGAAPVGLPLGAASSSAPMPPAGASAPHLAAGQAQRCRPKPATPGAAPMADTLVESAALDLAGRTVIRRQRKLDLMAGRGQISRRHWAAAEHLYGLWEMAEFGVRSDREWLPPEVRLPPGPREPSVARLDAVTAYRDCLRAAGRDLGAVVEAIVLHELRAEDFGRRINERRDGVMALLRAGLSRIADHLGLPPG